MIVVRLMGGLGNQMFQYATARRLAHRVKAPLKFDMSFFPAQQKRRFRLDKWRTLGEPASEREIARFYPTSRKVQIRTAIACAIRFRPTPRLLVEQGARFDPQVLAARDEAYLDGYWQSEKYFADIAALLREEFTPRLEPGAEAARLAAEMAATTAVSVHVRRGDYVSEERTAQFHPVCSLDYYRDAIARITVRVPAPHFFVFSDEPAWAREHLRFDHPATYVSQSHEDADIEELWLMSRCQHHIVANSSFSWWGAWLNARPGRQVLAPRHWFKTPQDETSDICPPDWELL
jgi:hypothetical protein